MSNRRASLKRNGHVRDDSLRARHFITRTPPRISPGTRIVAATYPSVKSADPTKDGWFVSDFYAFNYLLKGQGRSQVWLTAADPHTLIEKYGDYLHGNPFQDRKVVLSKKLLDSGELTAVTVVRSSEIVDQFLRQVKAATEEVKRDGGAVLLLVFCHGTERGTLTITRLQGVLEPYVPVCLLTTACFSGGWSVSTDINVTTMTAALENRVSLSWPKSTSIGRAAGSVFAGSVIAALARTADDFPEDDNQPFSVDAIRPEDDSAIRDEPELSTPEQVATYNSFCKSIWQSCQGLYRLWHDHHHFSFSAQGDEWEEPWTRMTGMTPEEYGARWASLDTVPYVGAAETKNHLDPSPNNPYFLGSSTSAFAAGSWRRRPSHDPAYDRFVGPFLESMRNNDIKAIVELWRLNTCPGDEAGGWGPRFGSFLQQCVDTGKATPETVDDLEEDEEPELEMSWNVVEILRYRWNMAALAEDILDQLNVPRPAGQSCIMWNEPLWAKACCNTYFVNGETLRQKLRMVSRLFSCHDTDRPSMLTMIASPAPEQGPIFPRFLHYLTAGITESLYQVPTAAGVSEPEGAEATQDTQDQDRASFLVTAALDRVQEAILFQQQTALNNPEVRRRGREWALAMQQ